MAWTFQAPPELTDDQYARWQTLLEARTGICFLQHKSILQKGLSQRMREIGCEDYEAYFRQVSKVPEGVIEWTILVDRISVKETSFFREPQSYKAVEKYLEQRLCADLREQDYTLDLWSVGCSTGEESYSLAMMANEVVERLSAKIFLGVMATDISKTALDVAKQGRYPAKKLAGLPVKMKEKYFAQITSGNNQIFEVTPELKQRICFVQGNIAELKNAPKMAMDIIYCQNVLVYFRKERHKEVLAAMVERLKPGGLMMLGPGEVVGWQHPQMVKSSDETVLAFLKRSN